MHIERMPIFASLAGEWSKGTITYSAAKGNKPAEIVILGPIGFKLFDETGTTEKEFRDALAQIPEDQEIVVTVNSEGGSVQDGLGIYNAIAARRDKITCRIHGYACSIASFFPLAAKRVVSSEASMWMIHEPWTYAGGNAESMRKTADRLEAHAAMMAERYAAHTGKPLEEIRDAMRAETWLSGKEAKAWGFAHETTDEDVSAALAQITPDVSRFRNPPAALAQIWNSRRPNAAAKTQDQNKESMNRTAILAALRKAGKTVNETATDAELQAAIQALVTAGQMTAAEAQALGVEAQAPAAAASNAPAGNTGAGNTGPTVSAEEFRAMGDRLRQITEERDRERRNRIERDVDACVAERRITADQRDAWVTRALADETIIASIRALPQHSPGGEPLVAVTASDPRDVLKGIEQLRAPTESFLAGNEYDGKAMFRASLEIGRAIRANRDRLIGVMNATTHTVPAKLKRVVIVNDLMRDFKRAMINLNAFTTVYANVALEGTDEITIPYYPLFTTASKDWVAATGYVYDGTTAPTTKDVKVDKRKYQPMDFDSEILARQPYFNPEMNMRLRAEQLGQDVFADVAGIITAANFDENADYISPEEAFDYEDTVNLKVRANRIPWPKMGRTLVLESGYEGALTKDDRFVHAEKSGTTAALREGSIGRASGFDVFESPAVPDNSENLVGFALFKSAILVATAPIAPAPAVRKLLYRYELVVDPDTGISFAYRTAGDTQMDRQQEVIETFYGFAVGEKRALIPIRSAQL